MWSLSGRPTSGTGRGNSKSARGQIVAEDTCSSGVHNLEIVYILCDFSRVFHGSLPSCTLWEGSKECTATAGRTSPKPALCGPLCRTSLRLGLGETLGCEAPSFPDGKAPGFSACAARCGRFGSQVGERPVPARSGAIWAPQGPVWQKEKKTPTTPGLGRIWGCDSQAGERPGVAGASPAGSPRPAEPVVAGFLPSSTTKKIRGRLGGLGVTTRVRNRKFPGGKPFLRVSPPGSTKG